MVVANGDHMDCLNSVLGVNRFVVVLHTARRNTGLNTTCCVTPYRYSRQKGHWPEHRVLCKAVQVLRRKGHWPEHHVLCKAIQVLRQKGH